MCRMKWISRRTSQSTFQPSIVNDLVMLMNRDEATGEIKGYKGNDFVTDVSGGSSRRVERCDSGKVRHI